MSSLKFCDTLTSYFSLARKYIGILDEILRVIGGAPYELPLRHVKDIIIYCIVIKGSITILLFFIHWILFFFYSFPYHLDFI